RLKTQDFVSGKSLRSGNPGAILRVFRYVHYCIVPRTGWEPATSPVKRRGSAENVPEFFLHGEPRLAIVRIEFVRRAQKRAGFPAPSQSGVISTREAWHHADVMGVNNGT